MMGISLLGLTVNALHKMILLLLTSEVLSVQLFAPGQR